MKTSTANLLTFPFRKSSCNSRRFSSTPSILYQRDLQDHRADSEKVVPLHKRRMVLRASPAFQRDPIISNIDISININYSVRAVKFITSISRFITVHIGQIVVCCYITYVAAGTKCEILLNLWYTHTHPLNAPLF